MKTLSQMTREEKLQEILEYNPCRVERNIVLRYLLAMRHNDKGADFLLREFR